MMGFHGFLGPHYYDFHYVGSNDMREDQGQVSSKCRLMLRDTNTLGLCFSFGRNIKGGVVA